MSHPQLARNTFYLTAASVGQKLLSFVYFLLIARLLMPERTGAYVLSLSFLVIFLVVADVGITSVVIRDVAQHVENAARRVRLAMAVKIPATALAIIAASVMSWILGYDPIVRELIALGAFILIADSFSLFLYGVLRGHHLLWWESIGMFLGQLITLSIGSLILLTSRSLPLLMFALIAGSIFNLGLSVFQVSRKIGWKAFVPLWDRKAIFLLLKTALPFFLAAIFVKIYNYIDIQLLYMFLGKAVVGIYAVAYKYTYAFQFLPLAFIAALYPSMSRAYEHDRTGLSKLFEQAMWYLMLLVMPLAFGLWSLAEDAVALTGHAYGDAVPVLQTLVFALIPNFMDFPVGSLLNAAGRQGTKTVLFGIAMSINFVLNLFLIPRFGMVGAAVASIISLSVLFLTGLWYANRLLPDFHPIRLLKFGVPMAVSGIIMAGVATWARPWFDRVGEWAYHALQLPSGSVRLISILLSLVVSAVVYFGLLIAMRVLTRRHLEQALDLVRRKSKEYVEAPAPHA